MTTSPDVTVKPEELENLSKATLRLWSLDVNRFKPGKDYAINLQNSKNMFSTRDVATENLFKGVSKQKFFGSPTFKAFYNLLDNYERETGKAEVVTAEEITENWTFLNLICDTPCMKYVHNYLKKKKLASSDMAEFKKQLYELWFKMYKRDGKVEDSSGFEHVFVGEMREGKVIGFHNWIQFFIEEKNHNVDYQGFIAPKRKTKIPDDHEQLITIQFLWGDHATDTHSGNKKDVTSTFVGTSPEFEIALFTLCFLIDDKEDHIVEVGDPNHIYHVNIKCFRWHLNHCSRIAAVFPVALDC